MTSKRFSVPALIAIATLAVTALPTPASAGQRYYVPVTKVWTVDGHGYGHGHGMSQYGAQGAALQGLNYTEIADFYYPKTSWGTVRGTVRVLISADTSSDLQVRPRGGLSLTDLGDNTTWRLPRTTGVDRWRLAVTGNNNTIVQSHTAQGWERWTAPDGRRNLTGEGQFKAPGPITLLVPGGSDVVGKRYRGALRMAAPYGGTTARDTVNVVTWNQYVMGVVPYEMPASWHPQALRAQAVAARTFGAYLRAQNRSRYYQICDTTSCQVYGGVAAEQESSNNAVTATEGKILTYKRKPALTQFSSSSGGWTSAGGLPYLVAKRDPYDDHPGNAMHSWTTQVNVASLEAAHPEIGPLVDMQVTRRENHGAWGGRVLQIKLNGTKGVAYMTGEDFRWRFGLRSNWFTIEPTPIIERWREIGAAKSSIGRPKSGEYKVLAGAAQNFDQGRIYWRKGVGAFELRGRIKAKYSRLGGPTSALGWPTSGMNTPISGGLKARFQKGRIYYIGRVGGAYAVTGRILDYWAKRGSTASDLGFPTSDVTRIKGGQRGKFEHGTITWQRSTDTFTVTTD